MIPLLRPTTWFWLALVLTVGYAMFQVKDQVKQLDGSLADVNRKIDADREETRVLEAVWSRLNQPAHLDELRRRFLPNLTPLTGSSYGSLDQVPFRRGEQGVAPNGAAAPGVNPGPTIALPGGPALASVRHRMP
jgi:hypothetical protein